MILPPHAPGTCRIHHPTPCECVDRIGDGAHAWDKQPTSFLVVGIRHSHYKCLTCKLSYLVKDGDVSRKWTFGTLPELWDGQTSCADVVRLKAETKAKADADLAEAVRVANEREAARIAAGGEPLPPQAERIAAAIKAAQERAPKRR